MIPKQRGLASKSAQQLKNSIRNLHLSKRHHVQCTDFGSKKNDLDDLEYVDNFIYLGNLTGSMPCSLKDIKHRLAIARSRFGGMMSIWKDKLLPLPLKIKIYRSYICTMVGHSQFHMRLGDLTHVQERV